ncbi:MAG: GntR family transcriptional regulator [Oscillospiraceae bacterium]|nr:GntR family transcriptional regulator [Oscillospiraceae bacterium]
MEDHLYMQIVRRLEQDILSGMYGPSDMLPSENTLAARFNVSRVTIRKSLDILKNNGLITAMHGKGYFIKPPQHNRYSFNFDSNTGVDFSHFQKVEIIYPDAETMAALNIPATRRVVAFHRVQERAWTPVAYDEKFVPYERGMPTVEIEIKYAEFPELLSARHSPFLLKGSIEIDIAVPPDYVAKALDVPPDKPMLVMRRFLRNRDGVPYGFGRNFLTKEFGPVTAESGYSLTHKF